MGARLRDIRAIERENQDLPHRDSTLEMELLAPKSSTHQTVTVAVQLSGSLLAPGKKHNVASGYFLPG